MTPEEFLDERRLDVLMRPVNAVTRRSPRSRRA